MLTGLGGQVAPQLRAVRRIRSVTLVGRDLPRVEAFREAYPDELDRTGPSSGLREEDR